MPLSASSAILLSAAERAAFAEGQRLRAELIAKHGEEQGAAQAASLAMALFRTGENDTPDMREAVAAIKAQFPRWENLAGGLAPEYYHASGVAKSATPKP